MSWSCTSLLLPLLLVQPGLTCNVYGDYCDMAETDAHIHDAEINEEGEQPEERSLNTTERTEMADAVTDTMDRLFDEDK